MPGSLDWAPAKSKPLQRFSVAQKAESLVRRQDASVAGAGPVNGNDRIVGAVDQQERHRGTRPAGGRRRRS